VRALWFSSALLGALVAQGPGTRLTYRVRIIETSAVAPRVLASGSVSGPLETDLRLTLHSDTAEVAALVQVTPSGGTDSLSVRVAFFTKRQVGRSRRGLPLWEEDAYQRITRLAWSDTTRIYPYGAPPGARPKEGSAWIELVLERTFAGGEARPAEETDLADSTRDLRLEAVVRPRRARVTLNLVRGDTVSAPRPMDLVPDEPSRIVQLVLGRRATTLEVSLRRPPPDFARTARERALALDVDVVCLRVASPADSVPYGLICGRLNNVARQLPLPSGDTLAATFNWPGPR
jgi:hypothetical protein